MPRPAASDVNFTLFGLVNFTADLLPLTESKKEAEYRMVCAACMGEDPKGTPSKLDQRYLCSHDEKHGPFMSGDAARAVELGTGKNKSLVYVTDEEIATVKEPSLPPKQMSLNVVPTAQLEEATRPSGKAYRLVAEKGEQVVRMIADLIAAEPEYAFVGECNVARSQSFYRLVTWKGDIIMQEMARPDEVIEFEPTPVQYDPRVLDQAKKLVAATVENFDPIAFRNTVRERARALTDAKSNGLPAPVAAAVAAPASSGMDDLLALLEAAAKKSA